MRANDDPAVPQGAAMLDDEGMLSDGRAVVAVSAGDPADALTAIRATRGMLAVPAAWTNAAERVAQQPLLAAVVVVCDQLDDTALIEQLPVLAAAAADAGARLIVGFATPQIDAVAGALLGDAVLLCDPTVLEWAAALAIAAADPDLTVRDTAADDDRYRRLSEEVARIAEMLVRITGRADAPGPNPAGPSFVAEAAQSFAARAVDLDPGLSRRAIRARRLRDQAFGLEGLFEDPAWDMLLDLFAAELERRRVSVSSLCIAAAVAPTTALRWIGKLMEAELLERRPDPQDRRRAFISLSARGSTAMRNYVATLSRAGLMLA